jgi:enoyl-CoA hydratase
MAFSKLRFGIQGPAAVITLDNPPVNALHPSMSEEILRALDEIVGDSAVRGVVITGSGRHFVAGGDITLFPTLDARTAKAYAQPEVRLGLMPGAGGTQNLPRLIRIGQAKRMLFSGHQVDAPTALTMGLIDEMVPNGQCLKAALALIDEIAACAPIAVSQIKRAVNLGLSMSAIDGHRLEASLFGELFCTEDLREGVNAFLGKRRPNFKGR